MQVEPIDTLENLLKWPLNVKHHEACPWVSFIKPRTKGYKIDVSIEDANEHYQTMICHDFEGGYTQDRFCNGSSDNKAYKFSNWSGVDTFVYFSHHFVTIPPCGWIKAAHQHGVKILGTFITEWDAGAQIWEQILDSQEIMQQVANQLCKITSAFKFDGWLINIENNIKKVDKLLEFLVMLNESVHALNDNFKIIWYDSVTKKGEVDYQNALTDLNKIFFDVCDGIYLNYHWKVEQLESSKKIAGDRYLDVYAGIDMCGRGTYAGGGYASCKAMEVIRKQPLSAVLFAQGWTYMEFKYNNFFANENIFWSTLQPFLLYHGVSGVPLATSFCSGYGDNLFVDAQPERFGSWYNLSRQQVQPLWEIMHAETKLMTQQTATVYNGGSAASIWCDETISLRLLITEFKVSEINFIQFIGCGILPKQVSVSFWVDYESSNGSRWSHIKMPHLDEAESKNLVTEAHSPKNGWVSILAGLKSIPKHSTIRSVGVTLTGTGAVHFGYLAFI